MTTQNPAQDVSDRALAEVVRAANYTQTWFQPIYRGLMIEASKKQAEIDARELQQAQSCDAGGSWPCNLPAEHVGPHRTDKSVLQQAQVVGEGDPGFDLEIGPDGKETGYFLFRDKRTTPQSSAPVVGKTGRAEFVKGYLLASMAHAHSSLKIETLERHAELAADKAGYASESALTGRG